MTEAAHAFEEKESTPKAKRSYWGSVLKILPAVLPPVLLIYALFVVGYNSFLTPGMGETAEATVLTISSLLFLSLNGFLFAFIYGADKSNSGFAGKLKEGARTVGAHFGPLLSTSILFFVLIVAGTIMFIVPALIMIILFYLYPFVVIEENKKNFEALKGSAALVKKGWLRVMGWIILFYVSFLFAATVVSELAPAYGEQAGEIIGGAVVLPFEALLFYFVYKKLKAKQQGA
ncbi:hypothetical protein CR205_14125 [Alteribacter lacisalsi]|uniref:Glycerophosphoryl diester phosphodiesterase membrane domain-containing protein n=1 Tax=Alteribacter lacisalsi TaxID=2045244 RepID=A0A2W0H4Q6_9BACI|nr:hypothetical protein [Alteribacter lacisalsi]PYZ96813.1 hypothetical protein CR205_14125 [Alteribacter lacisalsi]